MIPDQISLLLNGAILILLMATMVFAGRLSLSLKEFRSGRQAMEKTIADLIAQVARAEQAIAGMREAAREAGRDLQGSIREAQAMVDELSIMTDSANSMATRLAGAVEKGRPGPLAPLTSAAAPKQAAAKPSGFTIRDPEFDQADNRAPVRGAQLFPGDPGDDADDLVPAEGLQSRAEKELYEALKSNKSRAGRVT